MGDIDQNKFQTQQLYDIAEQADAENRASKLHNNNVRIMNIGEWTNKEKLKLLQIYREERQKTLL